MSKFSWEKKKLHYVFQILYYRFEIVVSNKLNYKLETGLNNQIFLQDCIQHTLVRIGQCYYFFLFSCNFVFELEGNTKILR